MHAQLVLERDAAQVVAPARAAVRVGQELGHDEQRDARGAGGRAVEPGQHEMDDVLGQIVLAVGDEDLGAEDAVAVAVAHRPGAQGTDVRARLRLGQAHGAGPAAADQRLAVDLRAAPRVPWCRMASMAPWVSSGQSWNERLAAFQISAAAVFTSQGSPGRHSAAGRRGRSSRRRRRRARLRESRRASRTTPFGDGRRLAVARPGSRAPARRSAKRAASASSASTRSGVASSSPGSAATSSSPATCRRTKAISRERCGVGGHGAGGRAGQDHPRIEDARGIEGRPSAGASARARAGSCARPAPRP